MPDSKYAAKLRRQGRRTPAMTPLDKLREQQVDSRWVEPTVPGAGARQGRRPGKGVTRKDPA